MAFTVYKRVIYLKTTYKLTKIVNILTYGIYVGREVINEMPNRHTDNVSTNIELFQDLFESVLQGVRCVNDLKRSLVIKQQFLKKSNLSYKMLGAKKSTCLHKR